MGFSLTWLAVRGKPREAVLQHLELTGTGIFEELPEAPLTGGTLGEWYIVLDDHSEMDWMEHGIDQSLSAGCEVVACMVVDQVGYSETSCWKDGKLAWAIIDGADGIEVEGDPPPLADPPDPVNFAAAITGYRHDEVIAAMGELPYEVLELAD